MPDTPNILLCITDNQRLDTLGLLGLTPCLTPHWDKVGQRGAVLDHVRTASPICSPARAALMTGCNPFNAGMPSVGFAFAESNDGSTSKRSSEIGKPPLAHFLREAGYETMYAGKWHLGDRNIGRWYDQHRACDQADRDYSAWCRSQDIPDGFIFHDPERSKPFRSRHAPHMSLPHTCELDIPADKEHNRWVLGHAMEQLALRDDDRPFFATLSFEGPHPPLAIPQPWYDMYDPASVPVPDNWDANDCEPDFLADGYYRKLRHEWGDDFDAWRKAVAVYWGYTSYVDALLGRYFDELRASGALDNTIVVMVSDHGDMMGQHALSQKMCPYEEAVRVPCVIAWPGRIQPGTRLSMDVGLQDIAPTLLDACGLGADAERMDGESLLPHLTGERPEPEQRDCFIEYTMSPFQREWQGIEDWRCIVRRPWKYVLHRDGQRELFHLQDDPRERNNLAGDDRVAEAEAQLHERVFEWCRRVDPQFAASQRSSLTAD